jgi:glutamate-1-semialdehyde 2,1-aminomutase
LREHGENIAAAVVEPVCANMGLCLPEAGYLQALRQRTASHGVVLIFDEVITGFRVGQHGAQGEFCVSPDVTCLGKALGGGLPIAAVGGRADVLEVLAPEGPVFAGGTFSGNPACVSAAHAFLDAIESDPALYTRIEQRARDLARGLTEIIASNGLHLPVVHCESMVDFMFRAGPPHRNMQEAREADAAAYARYYRKMLDRGILLPPSQMELMFLTAAHSDADIEATLRAAKHALA